jgi:GGDEF domain-containing protein
MFGAMDKVAAAFWGAYFGTVALVLAASLAAFLRSLYRMAVVGALSAVLTALFVVAALRWLPVEADAQLRAQAHVVVLAAMVNGMMLPWLLGLLRQREMARRAYGLMLASGAAVLMAGWLLEARPAIVLAWLMALGVCAVNLALAVRSGLRGERLARVAVTGVAMMLVCTAGLAWISVQGGAPWPLHALCAAGGMVYLASVAVALWSRYSYLLELSEVMAHGPGYCPVTRMRSHSETGQLVGDMFFGRDMVGTPLGVIAVTIANLRALESLHGRAAFNHALYICAGRLRRHVPPGVEMGRLGEDGFLLLLRDARDTQRLVRLARLVRDQLARVVVLGSGREPGNLDMGGREWLAEAGVGLLAAGAELRPSQAVATARAMSRTAWSYPSRLAWLDPQGKTSELPGAYENTSELPGAPSPA